MRISKTPTIPLVAFSGGLDSTALVYFLSKINPVIFVFSAEKVGHPNEPNEQTARKRIIEIISKMPSSGRIETKDPVFVSGLVVANIYPQSTQWLCTAITNLQPRVQSVNLAYVAEDKNHERAELMKKIWPDLVRLSDQDGIFKDYPPHLAFPLIETSKTQLMQELPAELLNEVVWCSYGTNCGECDSCRTARASFLKCADREKFREGHTSFLSKLHLGFKEYDEFFKAKPQSPTEKLSEVPELSTKYPQP